jgi:TP901 family phage tail tape measure protein/lambda family phage tail tape measure protein
MELDRAKMSALIGPSEAMYLKALAERKAYDESSALQLQAAKRVMELDRAKMSALIGPSEAMYLKALAERKAAEEASISHALHLNHKVAVAELKERIGLEHTLTQALRARAAFEDSMLSKNAKFLGLDILGANDEKRKLIRQLGMAQQAKYALGEGGVGTALQQQGQLAVNAIPNIGAMQSQLDAILRTEQAATNAIKATAYERKMAVQATRDQAAATREQAKASKEASDHTQAWGGHGRDLHSAARGVASSFNAMWLTWGNILPLLAGAAVGNALAQAVKKGAEFEYHLTFVKALGGESAAAIDKLSESVLKLGSTGLYGPVKLSEGLQILEQAGIRATEVMSVLPHVMDLATVGEMSMADAARTLVGVMQAFNLSTIQAGHVGDVFSKAAAESQTSVEQMTAAMRTASVAGAMYGATMEDTATALTILAKINITGTASGTSFRNMLKELYTPTEEAKKAFKLLGVSASDAEGRLKPFADIVYGLREKLKDYDKISQTNLLQKMFGERGSKEAVAMLSMSRTEWDKLQGSIKASSGFMMEVAAQLEVSTKGAFMQAMNNLEVSFIKAFKATDNGAKDLAVSLKVLFSSQGVVDGVAALTSGVLGLARVLVDLAPQITMVVGAIAALAAVKVTHAVVVLLAEGLLALGVAAKAAFAAVTTSLFSWATGGSLGLAAMMTPLGWVTAGVVALGAAWWYFHTDSGSKALTDIDNLTNALERQLDKLQDVNQELIKKIELELKGTTSGAHEVNRAEAEVQRLEHEIAKAKEVAPVEGIDQFKDGARKKRAEYAQAQRLIVEGEDKLAGARKTAASLKLAEQNREALADGAALAEQQRKHRESPSDPLTTGPKKYVPTDRDAERTLSAEAKAYADLYNFEEKLAKDNYMAEVGLAKLKLDSGLMTHQEFSDRRRLIEDTYRQETEVAYDRLYAGIGDKISAAERKSTQQSMENTRNKILGQQVLQEQADANSERVALEKTKIKALGESHKFNTKTLPGMLAKDDASEKAAWAGVQNSLLNSSDKAAAEAEIAKTKEYDTVIAGLTDKLEALYETTGGASEATIALEFDIMRATLAMNDQVVSAGKLARALVAEQQSATFGMRAGLASYIRDVENVGATTERIMVNAFKGMEDALVKFVQTGKLDFKSLTNSIISDMLRMSIQQSITGPLANMAKGFLTNALNPYSASNVGSTGMFTGPKPSANGNVFASSDLSRYSSTIVSSPTLFKFAQGGAFRQGLMGEAGPEAIMPLTRGADGKLGVQSSGGSAPAITVNVINQSGQQLSAKTQGAPQFDGESWVLGVVVSAASTNPSFRSAMGIGR